MVNILLKSSSLQGKNTLNNQYYFLTIILIVLNFKTFYSQLNYVSNPSFEQLYDCAAPNYVPKAKFWNCIDSVKPALAGENYNTCYPNVPLSGVTYQWPKTGNGFIRMTFYCTTVTCLYNNSRIYPKNRLVTNLISGKTYCVKMYVNLQNTSPYAIDALQILLADAAIDTIKYVNTPLTYLTPQITNTLGIINDTLNWIKVENTFVANGNEKYLVIGNFKPDAAVNTTSTGVSSGVWSEYMIDDVSVIDFNLPAFAGPDKNINLGDSAFIGRPPEIGLECTWATGTTTIGTGGGLWVKPLTSGTFSYVVTQNICGNIKTDTVNVNVSPGLVSENDLFARSISLYPQPAKDVVMISVTNYYELSLNIDITDINGKTIKTIVSPIKNGKTIIETSELNSGIYFLHIKNTQGQVANKRLVVAR